MAETISILEDNMLTVEVFSSSVNYHPDFAGPINLSQH